MCPQIIESSRAARAVSETKIQDEDTVTRDKRILAHMVFSNATLQAIAARNPSTLRTLEGITGIGGKTLSLYGNELLEVLGA